MPPNTISKMPSPSHVNIFNRFKHNVQYHFNLISTLFFQKLLPGLKALFQCGVMVKQHSGGTANDNDYVSKIIKIIKLSIIYQHTIASLMVLFTQAQIHDFFG